MHRLPVMNESDRSKWIDIHRGECRAEKAKLESKLHQIARMLKTASAEVFTEALQ